MYIHVHVHACTIMTTDLLYGFSANALCSGRHNAATQGLAHNNCQYIAASTCQIKMYSNTSHWVNTGRALHVHVHVCKFAYACVIL